MNKTVRNSKTTSKTRNKRSIAADDYDDDNEGSIYTPSLMESDIDTECDPVECDVNYKIQSIQSVELSELIKFFSEKTMINKSNDPSTNIIDRQNYKSYNVPDKKIAKMFKALEACRRAKLRLMFTERQQDYSGIVLDFDIYQDEESDQLSDEIFYTMCQKTIELLMKIINFTELKKETFHIGITRRPKITYNEEKSSYKDGFHIIIPGIKVTRGVKRLLINKLIENELIDQILAEVTPGSDQSLNIKGEAYQRKHFLDINSAHFPVFFIGSATKKGHAPYVLTHVYEVTVNFDTKNIMLVRNESMLKTKSVNICNEFSINYECVGGVIKKAKYDALDKFNTEIAEMNKSNINIEEANKNFGMLSMNSIHDAQIKEIRDLLDTLDVKRADDFNMWRDVIFALANTSPSYKDLAEYFSRKSKKFDSVGFEKLWGTAVRGQSKNKKAITLGSIHHWAKTDNPDRYNELRKCGVQESLLTMVYEGYKEGILSHSDIAALVHKLLKYKYVTDIPVGERTRIWYEFIIDEDDHVDGELYKWRRWTGSPVSLSRYISETLPALFEKVFITVKKKFENSTGDIAKYYSKVLQNFKGTMRKLGDRNYKKNILGECEDRFSKCGFSEMLDKDPMTRGVQNGILKLSRNGPQLIQGYHTHLISKYTEVPYIAFDPYDPLTKKILLTLRALFPDAEPDSFEFTMYYLASTIDGNPKESMFMIMVGKGSNGKTFLVELHKAAIGSIYGVKMPLSYLTSKSTSADTATPAVMMLKEATFAYYSESDRHEVLNASRMKEVTGLETLAGRKLHQDMINFKPRCHHLVTTNYDFDITAHDHGTWRRIVYNPLKIKFVNIAKEKIDINDPNQRVADTSITQSYTEDIEVRGRYLGYMVWMNYWLYNTQAYQGEVWKVPHPHIEFETTKYERRQNVMSAFIAQRCVKVSDETTQFSMTDENQKYIKWYTKTQGGVLPAKGITELFQNSEVKNYIKNTTRGLYMTGYRFLDDGEVPGDDEEYAMKNIFDIEPPPDHFGIKCETPEQFYENICKKYDKYKHIFNGEARYDVDTTIVPQSWVDADNKERTPANIPDVQHREDNIEINGRILQSGIVLHELPEPTLNYLTDDYHLDMVGFLPDDDDSDWDETAENIVDGFDDV